MPLIHAEQNTPEWLAARAGKVTASTAAGCLGIEGADGPLATFNEITSRSKQADNPWLQHGRDNEAKAVAEYECMTGNLTQTTGFWIHPVHDWLGASPDRLVGSDGLAEIKCPIAKLPKEIPEKHLVQCQVQLAVTERKWCDYFSWMEGGFYTCRVWRVPEVEYSILEMLHLFYGLYLAPDEPPPRMRSKLFTLAESAKPVPF